MDIIQNWQIYEVSKAYKDWVRYDFPGVSQAEYDRVVDQLAADALFIPQSYTISSAWHNTNASVNVRENWWDAINANNSVYYHYFWVRDTDTTAYSKFHLCVWMKTAWNNPTYAESSASGSDRFWFRPVAWRMKKSWNDVLYSALWYEFTSSYSSAKDQYYCINATNWTFSSAINCWISDDIWIDAVYANWTNACWITASESLPALNKTSMSVNSAGSNYFDLVATLTN